jgi:hypothetical protein
MNGKQTWRQRLKKRRRRGMKKLIKANELQRERLRERERVGDIEEMGAESRVEGREEQ